MIHTGPYFNSPLIVRRFLVISFNIHSIIGEVTIRQRRKTLEVITRANGLSDFYTATLTGLKKHRQEIKQYLL